MTLLFDLDGTLIDTAPDFTHVLNLLRAECQLPPASLEMVRPWVSDGLAAIIQHGLYCSKNHSHYLQYESRFNTLYRECLGHYAQFFSGIPELLQTLDRQGIRYGIVTNKPSWLTMPLLETLELHQRIGCVVSGDTTKSPKPSPEPLLHACEMMGVQANNCIYIGDAERDIQAGRAAGMTTLGALFGYITSIEAALQWGADGYIWHPDEIWPWYELKSGQFKSKVIE